MTYLILKFLHVVLAITAVGANITYGFWLSRAAREPAHLGHVLKTAKFIDDRVANPSFGLLLVTGIAMLYAGRIPWTTPWILTSLVLYLVLIAVGLFGYTPMLRRQIEALAAAGAASPQYRAASSRARLTGIMLAVLVVVIVFLMVTKPALWG